MLSFMLVFTLVTGVCLRLHQLTIEDSNPNQRLAFDALMMVGMILSLGLSIVMLIISNLFLRKHVCGGLRKCKLLIFPENISSIVITPVIADCQGVTIKVVVKVPASEESKVIASLGKEGGKDFSFALQAAVSTSLHSVDAGKLDVDLSSDPPTTQNIDEGPQTEITSTMTVTGLTLDDVEAAEAAFKAALSDRYADELDVSASRIVVFITKTEDPSLLEAGAAGEKNNGDGNSENKSPVSGIESLSDEVAVTVDAGRVGAVDPAALEVHEPENKISDASDDNGVGAVDLAAAEVHAPENKTPDASDDNGVGAVDSAAACK
jgi:hypothetical protein